MYTDHRRPISKGAERCLFLHLCSLRSPMVKGPDLGLDAGCEALLEWEEHYDSQERRPWEKSHRTTDPS